jgi:hypothetical protein
MGLAPDFVKERQKRMEKRRAATERRKEAEREERQRRALGQRAWHWRGESERLELSRLLICRRCCLTFLAERESEREVERKARLAEKKRLKAEAKTAAASAEGAHGHSAVVASSSSSSSTSRAKISSRPTAPKESPCVVACGTCGCANFIPNMFKKGKCNSCFHEH